MTELPTTGPSPLSAADPLRRMRAYTLAVELGDAAWNDAAELTRHAVTQDIAPQLYRALGSITANVAEGYSRSSGKDRVRFFEYALGSVRECVVWYEMSRAVLGDVIMERIGLLTQIRRILLKAIPEERERPITRSPRNRP